MSEYDERDIKAQGQEYVKHVSAMTAEGLHSKSDIAAELAHRDIEIQSLREELERKDAELIRLYQMLESTNNNCRERFAEYKAELAKYREVAIKAHMAGQADGGIDPSYSNAQVYVAKAIEDSEDGR